MQAIPESYRSSPAAAVRWTAALAAVALLSACTPSQKQFKVTSYPPGATIYVEDKPRGQTNVEKLNIDFRAKRLVTVRLDRAGYQSTGMVLSGDDPEELFFVLQQSPISKEINDALKNIQTLLETLPGRISDQLKTP